MDVSSKNKNDGIEAWQYPWEGRSVHAPAGLACLGGGDVLCIVLPVDEPTQSAPCRSSSQDLGTGSTSSTFCRDLCAVNRGDPCRASTGTQEGLPPDREGRSGPPLTSRLPLVEIATGRGGSSEQQPAGQCATNRSGALISCRPAATDSRVCCASDCCSPTGRIWTS
jgi:hypothetical protein